MSVFFRSLLLIFKKDTKKREDLTGHQWTSEHGICIGKMEVPNNRGRELSYLAYLYLSKQKELRSMEPLRVNIFVDEEAIYLYNLKTQHLIVQYSLNDLTYVWIHPKKNHIFGFIATSVDTVSKESRSYFTAFKLAARAKVFAIRLERVFYAYMERSRDRVLLHSEASFNRLERSAPPLHIHSPSTNAMFSAGNLRKIQSTIKMSEEHITPLLRRNYSEVQLSVPLSPLSNSSGAQDKASSSADLDKSFFLA